MDILGIANYSAWAGSPTLQYQFGYPFLKGSWEYEVSSVKCIPHLDFLSSRQGTLQGLMIVSGEFISIIGPLALTKVYTLSGPIWIWLFEITAIISGILLWLFNYRRMIGKTRRLTGKQLKWSFRPTYVVWSYLMNRFISYVNEEGEHWIIKLCSFGILFGRLKGRRIFLASMITVAAMSVIPPSIESSTKARSAPTSAVMIPSTVEWSVIPSTVVVTPS